MIAGIDDIFDRVMNLIVPDLDEIWAFGKCIETEPLIEDDKVVGSTETWLYEGISYIVERYDVDVDHEHQRGDSYIVSHS